MKNFNTLIFVLVVGISNAASAGSVSIVTCELNGVSYSEIGWALQGYNSYIEDLELEEIFGAVMTGNFESVLTEKCARLSCFEDYSKRLAETVAFCLTPEGKENAKLVYKFLSSLAKFICEDGKDRLLGRYTERNNQLLVIEELLNLNKTNYQVIVDLFSPTFPTQSVSNEYE